MCTKGMRRSLHKLAVWLRRLCPGNSHQKTHPERFDPMGDKKLDSRNSSDTESENLGNHSMNVREMAQHPPRGNHTMSKPRTGIPKSEEYEKMVSGVT